MSRCSNGWSCLVGLYVIYSVFNDAWMSSHKLPPLLVEQLTMNNVKLVEHIATLGCPQNIASVQFAGRLQNVMCDVRVVCILMTIIVINVVADIAVRDAVYSINNEKKRSLLIIRSYKNRKVNDDDDGEGSKSHVNNQQLNFHVTI